MARILCKVLGENEEDCPPTDTSWVYNISYTGFDLSWSPVISAVEYQVDVFVNGNLDTSIFTTDTSVVVTYQSPTQIGDIIEYHIYTLLLVCTKIFRNCKRGQC